MNIEEILQEILSKVSDLQIEFNEFKENFESCKFQRYCDCGWALRLQDGDYICDNTDCCMYK